jgi:hypothetical protein
MDASTGNLPIKEMTNKTNHYHQPWFRVTRTKDYLASFIVSVNKRKGKGMGDFLYIYIYITWVRLIILDFLFVVLLLQYCMTRTERLSVSV